ncbi:nuclear transport factor 2 family protein [Mycolicibacterium sp. jd]|uniref:nuclear transport factor 2 family protein n=1 Tax=unclassified Mycolicibacterium TaxID=2636767 RepID=UPI00351B6CCC
MATDPAHRDIGKLVAVRLAGIFVQVRGWATRPKRERQDDLRLRAAVALAIAASSLDDWFLCGASGVNRDRVVGEIARVVSDRDRNPAPVSPNVTRHVKESRLPQRRGVEYTGGCVRAQPTTCEEPMKHDRGAEGVRYLLAEYCHAIDPGETERWTPLFDDDARFTIDDLGELERPENISVFVDGALTSLREHGIAGIDHRTVNSAIDLDGDRATVTSDFAVVVPVPDGFATAGAVTR